MPICPKCKEEIDFLRHSRSGWENSNMYITGSGDDGYVEYEHNDFSDDGDLSEFYCPECNEELDFDDEQAEAFLRDKDELQQLISEKIKKDETNKTK